MLRRLHGLPGIALALALAVTALTGAVLSVQPALDRAAVPAIPAAANVADVAAQVAARHPGVSAIRLRADGSLTAAFDDGGTRGVERIDPATGAGLGPYAVSDTTRFITNLHRAFLLGDAGRVGAAIGALAMLGLSLSGLMLLARRLGGMSALLRPIRGTPAQRWHGELGRLAAVGLLLSSLTGLWMSASTFGLLPETAATTPAVTANGGAPAPVGTLTGLNTVKLRDLRELTFPDPADPTDVFTLVAADGERLVDAATGATLAMTPATTLERMNDLVRTLHTGRGAWVLGLFLGLASAMVPVLGGTGLVLWLRRRAARPRITTNVPARAADTVILVGSEGNSTWGFAGTLHKALVAAGHKVHTAAMNDVSAAHLAAPRVLVLAATYGEGAAPQSARLFLSRLAKLPGQPAVAVLGFGDRSFPHFCRFARDVADALEARGCPQLLPMKRVDRRSPQEFAQWGHDLGDVLGHDLTLTHVAEPPKTTRLVLAGRELYGEAVGAPVAILRFTAPVDPRTGAPGPLPAFEAGDLVGIVPPGQGRPEDAMPRFYSLASSTRDGVLEICVRLREGGLCSTFLHGLRPGEGIDAFIRENPTFRPAKGRGPLILIGAGAGIGPLAGFVRANAAGRPVHLYWGGRSAASDFLYEHELAQHLAERRLTTLRTAFSRDADESAYVQDRIAADAPRLRELVKQGAQILVCGGRDMAEAVTRALEPVVRPLGLDLPTLKSSGRYVEDVY
ncbi:sulfite reductase (NADPH) flavoprotein alpha-component [Xanthobacter flavus]|uniref:NADPH--hemoprotein reductase n=1 Tax=Xanthobacter flavus TaxID=281 RepID=A0A9W6CLR7_XANFL|nr:PepSY domain-containing protein [Xanthobacter flavus]MDR6334339.1 sulfite reductase (NADPH) flavoprotein alpha-component [Xanthobacter flavus]GLI23059.1 NADPH flavoprotein [Xanthobacter flavus]